MGGWGSGRWNGYRKKQTVEECLVLNVNKLAQDGLLSRNSVSGSLWWTAPAMGKPNASIGYTLDPLDEDSLLLVLQYTVRRNGTQHAVVEPILLQSTRPPFGGVRWWFTCPLLVHGQPCERRVGKLYLPPGAKYFGCRACYNLTYRSCQEHDKRVNALLRLPPEALRKAMDGPPGPQTFLALKAVFKGLDQRRARSR